MRTRPDQAVIARARCARAWADRAARAQCEALRGQTAREGDVVTAQGGGDQRQVDEIALRMAAAGLAERTFARRFSQAVGMSPLEYIHMLRLEEAKQMLESTDLPVGAVAYEVEYQDTSFFGRLFRRKVALTPAQYRRQFGALGAQLRSAAFVER